MKTIAILPVKRFAQSKQRLADALPARSRVALVQAMVTDVLIALRRAQLVDAVVVVTGEPAAEQIAINYNAEVLSDTADGGHSEAVRMGVQWALARNADRVLLVPGDVPMIDPVEIDGLLATAPEHAREVTIVPDRHGTGTNALVLYPPDVISAAFGEGSRARHEAAAAEAGAATFVAEPESITHDLDTADDFQTVQDRLERHRGGASHTRGLLPRLL
ncbi:MAG: 2-phospho-L-lactate guanylyltransferase [Solirubrobacteraceae bacterium]